MSEALNRDHHVSEARNADHRVSGTVAHQFEQPDQQRKAAYLGMWLFLGTESMMFGGLFAAILFYRTVHPGPVGEAVQHLHAWLAGTNSVVLLTSSITMSLAVTAAQKGNRQRLFWMLLASAGLALTFIGIKGVEYYLEYGEGLMPGVGDKPFPLAEPASRLFVDLYFAATGLHGLHLTVAATIALLLAFRTRDRGRSSDPDLPMPQRAIVIEMTGLYWHMVDLVWVFLYPALYLLGRNAA